MHSLMEPDPPLPIKPLLKSPLPRAGLVTPGRALLAMPAVLAVLVLGAPNLLAAMLTHVVLFLGSLIEPFDYLLPKAGLLRNLVTAVKATKKAWYAKTGMIDPNMQGFMDADDDDYDAVPEADDTAGEDKVEEDPTKAVVEKEEDNDRDSDEKDGVDGD